MEKGMVFKVTDDKRHMEYIPQVMHLQFALNELGTHGGECYRKLASDSKVVGAIRWVINQSISHPECARVLHEGLLVFTLIVWM